MGEKLGTPRKENWGLGTHRRLLPKVANSIHKPLPKVATLGQLRGGGSFAGGPERVLSQIPVYDHVKGDGGTVPQIRRTTLQWICELLEVQKTYSF